LHLSCSSKWQSFIFFAGLFTLHPKQIFYKKVTKNDAFAEIADIYNREAVAEAEAKTFAVYFTIIKKLKHFSI
jgi:hypothetical protein